MRISSGTLLTLLAVVASASADPLPCQTGTVADYQNTSCTIGNLSFTFGSATRSASVGFSATPSCFTLTPDASKPERSRVHSQRHRYGGYPRYPGRRWGGLDFPTPDIGRAAADDGSYGNRHRTSTGLSFNTIYALFDACDANNSLDCAGANPGSPFEQFCAGPSCSAHSDFLSPVASADLATSLLRCSAIGSGSPGFSSTITSASYYVSEAAPVPEPSSGVFLGAVLLGIAAGGILRRRKAHCIRR